MICNFRRYFLLTLASLFLLLPSAGANGKLPPNAWGDSSNWFCDDGYRKVQDSCQPIKIPENSWTYGDKWYCNKDFIAFENKCVSTTDFDKLKKSYFASIFNDTPIPPPPPSATNPWSGIVIPASQSAKEKSNHNSVGCAENGSCFGDLSSATGRPKTVHVKGYYRKDGTYVRGHYRSKPKN